MDGVVQRLRRAGRVVMLTGWLVGVTGSVQLATAQSSNPFLDDQVLVPTAEELQTPAPITSAPSRTPTDATGASDYIPSYLRHRLSGGASGSVVEMRAPATRVPAGENYLGPDLSVIDGARGGSGGFASSLIHVDEANRDAEAFAQGQADRILDLYGGAERDLIQRVRSVVEDSAGEDVTAEDWITVRGSGRRITWGGRLETDWVSWANDDDFGGQSNYLEFRRLRLFAAGEGYGIYDYQLEFEFAPEVDTVGGRPVDTGDFGVELNDAFLGMRDVPLLGYVIAGHFRTPIGLDERTSTRFNPFMERSLPTRLLPGREVGVAAFRVSPAQDSTVSFGVFFDDLDDTTRTIVDDNQGFRWVSRATWTPYYDESSGGRCLLHSGLGYAYTRPRRRNDDLIEEYRPVRFSARPEINISDVFLDTGDVNTDDYQIVNGELAWVSGPASIQGEFTWLGFDRLGPDRYSKVYGAYVFGSYFLTGESRPYDRNFGVFRRVTPYENFWMVPTHRGVQNGWGAWELAFRWSHLNFDDFGDQRLNDLTLGLNWYWTPHTRLMANWIHTYADNSPIGRVADAEGDIVALRLQVDF